MRRAIRYWPYVLIALLLGWAPALIVAAVIDAIARTNI